MKKLNAAERQMQIINLLNKNGAMKTLDLANYFHVSRETMRRDLLALTEQGLVCRRPKGNEYTVSDDRWVLEFYYSRRGVSDETLVHDVMTNEKMWGQDLTLVPGFEQAAAENLRRIRTEGARAAFAACLARPAV